MSESLREIPTFVARDAGLRDGRQRAARPTAREWLRHAALFLLTGLTMAWAGMSFMLPFGDLEPGVATPATLLDYLLCVPR